MKTQKKIDIKAIKEELIRKDLLAAEIRLRKKQMVPGTPAYKHDFERAGRKMNQYWL